VRLGDIRGKVIDVAGRQFWGTPRFPWGKSKRKKTQTSIAVGLVNFSDSEMFRRREDADQRKDHWYRDGGRWQSVMRRGSKGFSVLASGLRGSI